MRTPQTRREAAVWAAASVVPLIAVSALAGGLSAKSFNDVELATERAAATDASMLCPGPMAPGHADAKKTADAAFQATGPSTKVGFQAISIEPDSHALFGQSAVSETQRDEQGQPKRPATKITNHDGSSGKTTQTTGVGDYSLVGMSSVTQPFTVSSTSSSNTQPVLDAVQAMMTPNGDYRSLALARCNGVGVDRTFMGISTKPGSESMLVLHNPGDRAARASLTIAGQDGIVETSSASEVVVAPGATERVNVQALAPDHSRIALRVTVDGSALGMHLEAAERTGLTPMGAENIAPQTPNTQQVVPGVRIYGQRAAEVSVFNTTGVPANATVRMLKSDGTQAGNDITFKNIDGGAIATQEVKAPSGTYTLVVDSPAMVGASARSTVTGKDLPGDTVGAPEDFASMVPAPAITNSSLLALGNGASGGQIALHATQDTKVSVMAVKTNGSMTAPKSIEMDQGTSSVLGAADLETSDQEVSGFIVVPETPGAVCGAWVQTVAAGASGPVTSSVVLENNNVAATGMEVQARP